MFKLLFSFFILLHIIGDFYLQTDNISKRKNEQYRYVFLHSIIYAVIFIVGSIAIWSGQIFFLILILSFLHFMIDSFKYIYIKYINYPNELNKFKLYFIDQLLHIVSFVIAAVFAVCKGYTASLLPWAENMLMSINISELAVLSWACILLIICKPANITIKKMLLNYKPDLTNDDTSNNAGAFIGSLERLIIVLLLSVNQYSAIGLVLTAKSVARYDKISKDQIFSEYYLLGTLLSTLYVIVAFSIFI
ncbi:MAG: DUF3307 domain-containing protein [Syntrophomonadaceae bacterium]|nr:DUF3307 domain-containing protein [Syntrophomonadaceae bacterium]